MQRHRAGKVEQFRLQHGRGAQVGTGRHEGGIILSKKPPEWRLPPPLHRAAASSHYIEPLYRALQRALQRAASDSNFLRRKVEQFRLQQS